MELATEKVHVDTLTNKASIDATNGKVIYIVDNGEVEAIPLPPYGTLEIACQNSKIHSLQYRQTFKRK
ncbi:hypothetical protein ACOMCU_24750 [Lysinibacillus sp. UGB7]|uniref:hypothetical protein n=1 Tax=Lysinibacillus sp. UGB7 TaxID=3411039 RepID=UPI003B7BE12E